VQDATLESCSALVDDLSPPLPLPHVPSPHLQVCQAISTGFVTSCKQQAEEASRADAAPRRSFAILCCSV
jgi:hypothetical protein